MVRALVLRGLAAGLVAGLVGYVFALIFAEPVIQAAIDYEGARDEAQQALNVAAGIPVEPPGEDVVSRSIQSTVGVGVGMVAFGLAMGALFAVAFCLAWGRVGRLSPRVLAVLLAGAGFLTFYLVPILKYPANPPAVSHDDTIGARTGLFLVMVVGSVIAALIAVRVAQAVRGRLDGWNATLVGLLAFVVLTGALMLVLPDLGQLAVNVEQYGPSATETPGPLKNPAGVMVFPGFDPDLLYDFRLYSVIGALLQFAVIGLVFGALAQRVLRPGDRASSELTSR
jgi:hypothetical protein